MRLGCANTTHPLGFGHRWKRSKISFSGLNYMRSRLSADKIEPSDFIHRSILTQLKQSRAETSE